MLQQLIRQLCSATPRKSILRWIIVSGLFALSTFLNEHFELVKALGFSPKTEALIKLSGLYLYMLLTSYQFQKQKTYEIPILFTKAPDLDNSLTTPCLDAPEGTGSDEVGNKSPELESKSDTQHTERDTID